MELGAFSLSLSVKNLQESKEFYQKLGFKVFAGSEQQNYLIMKSNTALIGLFQAMFSGNIITFNPGWDQDAQEVNPFEDVRILQKRLKENDLELFSEVDEATDGPGSIMIKDPDGNLILIDQHR